MAGYRGTAGFAAYSASKSYGRVLAESLWAELKSKGIDVLAVAGGAIDTPGFRSLPTALKIPRFMILDAERVSDDALDTLAGGGVRVPGLFYKISGFVMNRLIPLKTDIGMMSGSVRE